MQDRVAEAMGMADEAFSQIRTVQSFVREAEETRRYSELLAGVVTAAIARARHRAMLFGVVGFVAFARCGRRALAGRRAGARRRSSPPARS